MTKRLFLSFSLITLTLVALAGATYAYFSSGKVLGSNTFQTGTVILGDFNTNLNVTGLVPGKWTQLYENVAVYYNGNVAADMYLGAGGTSGPGDDTYFADKLYVKIFKHGTTDIVWEGWVNALSTGWKKIASNVTAGWQSFDLQFYLDPSMEKQGITNTDTKILMYAVQVGGPVPATLPYLTSF